MDTPESNDLQLAHGLTLLMDMSGTYHFPNIDDCNRFVTHLTTHPFGLDTPEQPTIRLLDCLTTDRSVKCFLTSIRFFANVPEHTQVKKLRVLKYLEGWPKKHRSPVAPGDPRYTLIFEVWIGSMVLISGITTNYSGAGNSAKNSLWDVFEVLAHTYKQNVELVTIQNDPTVVFRDIQVLRQK